MKFERVVATRRSVGAAGATSPRPSKCLTIHYEVSPSLSRDVVNPDPVTETFGFQHLLWVYSGRRGIHCWISDPAALDLNDDQRRSLVTFLEVIKGSKEQLKKVNVRGPKGDGDLHPYLE